MEDWNETIEERFGGRGSARVTLYPVTVRWKTDGAPFWNTPPQVKDGFARKLLAVWSEVKAETPSPTWRALFWYRVDPNGYALVRAEHTAEAWRAGGLLVSKKDFASVNLDPFALYFADFLPRLDGTVVRPIAVTQSEICVRASAGLREYVTTRGGSLSMGSLLEPMLLGGDEVEIHRADQDAMIASLAMEWPNLEAEQRRRIALVVLPTRLSLSGIVSPRVMAISDRQPELELEPPRLDATSEHMLVEPKAEVDPAPLEAPARVPAMTLQASEAIRASLAQMRSMATGPSLLSADDRAAHEAIRVSLSTMPSRGADSGSQTCRSPQPLDVPAVVEETPVPDEPEEEPPPVHSTNHPSTIERQRLVDLHIAAIADVGRGGVTSSPSTPSHPTPQDPESRDERVLETWGLRDSHGPVVVMSSLGGLDVLAHVGKILSASRVLAPGESDVNPVGFTLLGPARSVEYVRQVSRALELASTPPRQLLADEYGGAGVALRCRAMRNLWARFGGDRAIGSGSEALVVVPTAPTARWPSLLEEVRALSFWVDAISLTTDSDAIIEDLTEQLSGWEELLGDRRLAKLKVSVVVTNLEGVTDAAQLNMWKAIRGSLGRIAEARRTFLDRSVLNDMSHLGVLTAKGLGAGWLAELFQEHGIPVGFFVVPSLSDPSVEALSVAELPVLSMLSAANLRLILDRRPHV